MSDSFCLVPSKWRHICPKVSDLSFTVSIAKPYAVLEIPKLYRLQGAHVASDLWIGLYGFQGAFRAEPILITSPTKGTVETYSIGWVYVPKPSSTAGQTDNFHYKLRLNQELSLEAIVTVTLTA